MAKDDGLKQHRALKQRQDEAKKLMKKSAWKISGAANTHLNRLASRDANIKNEKIFAQAIFCQDCAQSRNDSGDETSLCPAHLAEALGL